MPKRCLSVLLYCAILAQSLPLRAQQTPAVAGKIQIVIVEGEGAINNVRQRVAREPIIQVEDENRKPIAGAAVTFLLPNQGAGATFANGARSLTITTDAQGRAAARGLRPNNVNGQYEIRVNASHQGRTDSKIINQTNALTAAAAGGISAKLLAIIAIAGGAVAAGAVVATRNGGGNGGGAAPPSPTVIVPGSPNCRRPAVKKTLILLGSLSCCLYADTTVEGPSLGYVASGSAVRSLLGIVGAAQFSNPVVSKLRQAVVLPGTHVAFAMNADGALARFDLKDGSVAELGVSEVTYLAASPTGSIALAVSGSQAYIFANSGARSAILTLPAAPLTIAVSDRGTAIAVTVAESDGQSLYLIREGESRHLLHSSRLPALAFLPDSDSFVVSDDAGVISRFDSNLQLTQLGTVPNTRSLAATSDQTRLLITTNESVRSLRFANGEQTSVDCACAGATLRPLGGSAFLLTTGDDAPVRLVDASADELRLAFVPEVVNE